MKLDLILHHIQKSTQNGLKTNFGVEIIKCLEENTGGKLLDIDLVSNFLD